MAGELPGVELGTYYVSVTTSTKKLYRDLSAGSGAAGDAAGQTAGDAYANSFSKRASSGIVKGLKLGVAGLTGAVAFTGIDRLLNIDAAEAKLRGLGNTTQDIASIMDSALKSVQGTAFGLGDAATIAASAVAAGVGQGAELTEYLTLTADAASVAGVSLSEMGNTLNNVQTIGAAYNDTLQILAQKGIPIYSLLADSLGKTTGEIKQLASEGKVSADELSAALDTALGGSALTAGETIQGSFDNVAAALSRIGANLLAGGADQLPEFFADLTAALKPVEEVAKVVGTVVSGTVGVLATLPAPVLAGAAAVLILAKAGPPLVGRLRDARFEVTQLAGSMGLLRASTAMTGSTFAVAGQSIGQGTSKLATLTSTARTAGSALLGAFGGPVGIGLTIAAVAITSALGAAKQATDDYKASVDALNGTLDVNTGALTAETTNTVTEALDADGTLATLAAIGVSTDNISAKVLGQAAGYDQVREKLKGILAAEDALALKTGEGEAPYEYSDEYLATEKALKSLDAQYDAGKDASAKFERQLKANGKAADETDKKLLGLEDSVKSAFAALSGQADITSAFGSLKNSIAENGSSLDAFTANGAANMQLLQTAISTLASAAGEDQAQFVGSVAGLLDGLRAQGVDVTNIIQVVKNTLDATTRAKYGIYLDGSQAVAEAIRVVKANIAIRESAKEAAEPGDRGIIERSIANQRSQLANLQALGGVARSTTSNFNNLSTGTGKVASSAKSATKETKVFKSALDEFNNPGEDISEAAARAIARKFDNAIAAVSKGGVLSAAEIRAGYVSLVADVTKAFDAGKITKEQRTELLGTASDWMTAATEAAVGARAAVQTAFSSFSDWLNPSSLSSEGQAAIQSVSDMFDAGAINAAQSNELGKAIREKDAKIVAEREAYAEALEGANTAVNDALSLRDNYKKSIVDGYRTLGDITKFATATEKTVTTYQQIGDKLFATTQTQKTAATAQGMIDGLTDQVDAARKFKTAYEQLENSGLNDTSLQNIMSQFLSTGDASVAESLVAGGASAISQVNDLTAELGTLGTGLGDFGSSKMYDSAVQTAQGFLGGLKSQDSALHKQYEVMANDLLATFKQVLGIHSPSREMARLAKFTAAGWNDNLDFVEAAPQVVAPAPIGSGSGVGSDGLMTLHFYDSDGVLMGTMRGAASDVLTEASTFSGVSR